MQPISKANKVAFSSKKKFTIPLFSHCATHKQNLERDDCEMGHTSHSDIAVVDNIPNRAFIVHELEQENIVT